MCDFSCFLRVADAPIATEFHAILGKEHSGGVLPCMKVILDAILTYLLGYIPACETSGIYEIKMHNSSPQRCMCAHDRTKPGSPQGGVGNNRAILHYHASKENRN